MRTETSLLTRSTTVCKLGQVRPIPPYRYTVLYADLSHAASGGMPQSSEFAQTLHGTTRPLPLNSPLPLFSRLGAAIQYYSQKREFTRGTGYERYRGKLSCTAHLIRELSPLHMRLGCRPAALDSLVSLARLHAGDSWTPMVPVQCSCYLCFPASQPARLFSPSPCTL